MDNIRMDSICRRHCRRRSAPMAGLVAIGAAILLLILSGGKAQALDGQGAPARQRQSNNRRSHDKLSHAGLAKFQKTR